MAETLSIKKANEHNLKNISLEIPRYSLSVVTGVSGSGKSSLVYDTIFKEGQRRYITSLSAYARQYMQNFDKPDVEWISGLSPTICIDQKTSSRNKRSTVGTITEIYDFLRLLFARLGIPHCPKGHGAISGQTPEMIVKHILYQRKSEKVMVMAPMIVDKKGSYQKELLDYRQQGFVRILIDGKLYRLDEEIVLERYQKHTLEIVIDRLEVQAENRDRLFEAVNKALQLANNKISIINYDLLRASEKEATKDKQRVLKKDYTHYNTSDACAVCGESFPEIEPNLFSFNSKQGQCPDCLGLGVSKKFIPEKMIANPEKSIFAGGIAILTDKGDLPYMFVGKQEIMAILKYYKVAIDTPWQDIPPKVQRRLFLKNKSDRDPIDFEIIPLLNAFCKKYDGVGILEKYLVESFCTSCKGSRLSEFSQNIFFAGQTIGDFSCLTVEELAKKIETIEVEDFNQQIFLPIYREIKERLSFLIDVGLEYLTLDRSATTLSGGEAQRIRLSAQIGSGLEGCLYILDEPSIGLHQIDNKKLIATLQKLKSKNNTIVVIEHDEETMLAADYLIDIGPAAGVQGGEVVFADRPDRLAVLAYQKSLTQQYLLGEKIISLPDQRRQIAEQITIKEINKNNLKNVNCNFPLAMMTVLVGVSGSGKSTLMEVLLTAIRDNLRNPLKKKNQQKTNQKNAIVLKDGGSADYYYREIVGLEQIDNIIEIDQKAIGRSSRSNPATYTKLWQPIRELFTQQKEAKLRAYDKSFFSFNVKGGRCEYCQGNGTIIIDLQIFSNVEIVCEHCNGKRFQQGVLDIYYKNKNIYDILEMTVEEAKFFFAEQPPIERILTTLFEIGLGYLKLGQSSSTLSGGEAQRIKLATELCKRLATTGSARGKTLYFLDEPTTGLHFADIARLLTALQSLVEKGHTVIVIEHNLDVIKMADHLIELGPKGGSAGGKIIASGTPEELIKKNTDTGNELKSYLTRQSARESLKQKMLLNSAKTKEKLQEKKAFFADLLKEMGLNVQVVQEHKPKTIKNNLKKTTQKQTAKSFNSQQWIEIKGLRKNNLKNISLSLPKKKIITITGVSGSGKTSLAFGTIFAEGQRKYLESLSTYARRFLGQVARADADSIQGISPTIAVNQKYGSHNPRSIVATQTEIYDSLRVLYANVGRKNCRVCQNPLQRQDIDTATQHILIEKAKQDIIIVAPLFIDHPSFYAHTFLEDKPEKMLQYKEFFIEQGFVRLAINQHILRLTDLQLASLQFESEDKQDSDNEKIWKYQGEPIESIGLVIDRIVVAEQQKGRIAESFAKAYNVAKNIALVFSVNSQKVDFFSLFWHCYQDKVLLLEELNSRHFSFNHPLGSCEKCEGLGQTIQAQEKLVIVDDSVPFLQGALVSNLHRYFTHPMSYYGQVLKKRSRGKRREILHTIPFADLSPEDQEFLLRGEEIKGSQRLKKNSVQEWMGILHVIEKLVKNKEDNKIGAKLQSCTLMSTCEKCAGGRLKLDILNVTVDGINIHQLTQKNITFLTPFFQDLPHKLSKAEQQIAKEVIAEIQFRLQQMDILGIGYLTLERKMASLSGGEVQRIRLSTQIGNQLRDIIYVLDEPTIGLHEYDTQKLLLAIKRLQEIGNTVIMVEHDGNIMKHSDFIVDIGPAAGEEGGKVMYAGENKSSQLKNTSIYPYLYGAKKKQNNLYRALQPVFAKQKDPYLACKQVSKNNLKDLQLSVPLKRLVGFSGVSGSGKSSFLLHWLVPILKNPKLAAERKKKIIFKNCQETIFTKVEVVDQNPITTSKRTTPVTYLELMDRIRETFAKVPYAKQQGLSAGHFSFNSYLGNCHHCRGTGIEIVEMHFINNVSLVCAVCQGKRYQEHILNVFYKGKNIADVLQLSFQEAYEFFYEDNKIRDKIDFVLASGLGYLKLGISLDVLSGGELQRIKLAKELTLSVTKVTPTLYVLDEPTTGLHFADVEKLILILEQLIQKGHTVLAIEHNVEFLKNCDHLLDIGPGGGEAGGKVVATGSIEQIKTKKQGVDVALFVRGYSFFALKSKNLNSKTPE